ncbi:MAG: endonuclease III [Halarsenatibacteraceae bacterium]
MFPICAKLDYMINTLEDKYPKPETELNHNSPFELLVATILSAQTTDIQVNKVTEDLFEEYNTPDDFAKLNPEELADKIKSIGLYRNKSKFIVESSRIILADFDGQVPRDFSDLLKLPGVGRKTASVVLVGAFSTPAFPVDTHVFRVSNRLGLADSDNVEEVEKQLKELIPEELWADMHHWLIFHGREVCKARSPKCDICMLKDYCKFYQKKGD